MRRQEEEEVVVVVVVVVVVAAAAAVVVVVDGSGGPRHLPRVALRLLLEAKLLLLIPFLLPRRLPLGPLLVLLVADHLLVREPLLALVVEL